MDSFARLFSVICFGILNRLIGLVRWKFPKVLSYDAKNCLPRNRHLEAIAKHGRMAWQRSSGYNRRSLVETAVYRYKTIIGQRLHARTLPNQRTKAKIGCNILNRMTDLGMPVSVRIA